MNQLVCLVKAGLGNTLEISKKVLESSLHRDHVAIIFSKKTKLQQDIYILH